MKGIVETVAGVVERLSLSSTEKKRLQQELETKLLEYEHERLETQSTVVHSESGGNWLQRSWRPLVMLSFAAVVLAGMFIDLPLLSDGSRFWDLLEIGLGGYIVGRFRIRK
ncbi:MAG: holin family protein [Odoribacter sp.]|nr:holin family protein [Odoribacter sp.]